MSLVSNENRDASGFIGVNRLPLEIESEAETRPSFWRELVPAGFEQESPISILFRPSMPRADFISGEILEDPWKDTEDTVFEMYPEALNDVFTQEQKDFREQEIMRELENEQTLEAGGFLGFLARFTGGVIDPLILIPVGGTAAGGLRAGKSFLSGAVKTGTAGLLGITAAEAALQYAQQTRTMGQSITNIAAATLFSAVLGGSLSSLSAAQRRAAIAETKRALNPEVAGGALGRGEVVIPDSAFNADVTAANVLDTTNTEIALQKGLGVETVADLLNLNRGVRLMSKSQLQEMRGLAGDTFQVPFQTTGRAFDDIETQIVGDIESFSWRNILTHRMNFVLYRKEMALKKGKRLLPLPARMRAAVEDLKGFYAERRGLQDGGFLEDMNRRQFNETVARVEFLADDIDAFARETPQIPKQVIAQAKINRAIRDEIKELGIEVKLWGPEVKVHNADGYLNIVYKQDFIERGEFPDGTPVRTKLREELLEQRRQDEVERLKKATAEGKPIRGFSDAQLEDSVDSTIEKIIGAPAGRILYEEDVLPKRSQLILGPTTPKPTKARKINLPQEVLFKYSEQDSEFLLSRYVHSLLPEIRLLQKFDGLEGLRARVNAVRAEARAKINAAKTGAEKAKWQKMLDRNLKDYTEGIDLLRGVFNAEARASTPARFGRLIRNINSLSFAGTFARSSLPDVGLVVMARGVKSVIGDFIVPFITDFQGFKASSAAMRSIGVGTDLLTNSRAANLFEIGDPFGRLTVAERVPQALTGNMLLISLLSPWNAAWKTIAGVRAQNGLFRDLSRVVSGKANEKIMRHLNLVGIGPEDAIKMHEQWVKHGVTDRGFRLPNWMEWDEEAARQVSLLKNAIRREVNFQIIEPRVLDVPSWIDKETGKMIGQFRRFSFTATNRIALLGGQRLRSGELALLNGATLSATLGAMVSAHADLQARGEIQDRTPLQWFVEGLDRSGLTGTFFDINNPLEKVNLGIRNVIGGPTASRYQTRNIASSFLGPTFGRFQTVGQLAGTFGGSITGDQEFTQSDTKAMRRMMWYQNVVWADSLVDRIEEAFNEALGIPERPRRRRR